MKTFKSITLLALFFIAFGAYSQTKKDHKIIKDAEKAKQKMIKQDPGLVKLFDNASGYAIFPNVGEGAVIIGGASGNGVVYENGKAIGMANLKKVDIGAQIGGKAVAQVIFFETEDALNAFKTDDYAFSAEVSAVAVESGASENANYNDGVLVVAMPKAGLMADASVGGQQFEFTPFDQ